MENNANNAGLADLALGFVGGLNDIGPLIPALAPDIKLSVRIVLEDSGREARIDLGSRPPKVDFGSNLPPADITLLTKAQHFHDLLRGKLGIMQGWNEKKMLIEMTPNAFASLPQASPKKNEAAQVPGFVYELYLVSIGAKQAIGGNESVEGSISLQPHKKGIFQKISLAVAWLFGTLFGLVIRLMRRRMAKAQESDKPPKVDWAPIEELPKPGKPIALPRLVNSILSWFFDRVDMFTLARSFVGGARVTASF